VKHGVEWSDEKMGVAGDGCIHSEIYRTDSLSYIFEGSDFMPLARQVESKMTTSPPYGGILQHEESRNRCGSDLERRGNPTCNCV
jgi:hypothetical protein